MSEGEPPRIDIRQYAVRARELTQEDFDRINSDELTDALAQLNKINVIRFQALIQDTELGLGARFESYGIAGSAYEIAVSALHMARQRRAIEVAALLRVALESACTAIQLFEDPQSYDKYRTGRYQPTKAVSYVKKDIPLLGELTGALSQLGVHVNATTFGARIQRTEEGKVSRRIESYYGVRPPPTDVYDEGLLALVSLCTLIVLKAHEIILLEDQPRLPGWKRLVGTDTGYLHNTDEAIEKYRRMLDAFVQ